PPGRLDAYPQLLRTLAEELGFQRPALVRALLISREVSSAQALLKQWSRIMQQWTVLDERVVALVQHANQQNDERSDDSTRLDAFAVMMSQLAVSLDVPAEVATQIIGILRDDGAQILGNSLDIKLAL